MNKLFRSFTVRLTLWYALLFCISALVAFVGIYFLISSEIQSRTDEYLQKQVDEIARIYQLQDIATAITIARLQAEAAGEKRAFFRMFYRTGVVFASANLSQWGQVGMNRTAAAILVSGAPHFLETRHLPGPGSQRQVRIIYRRIGADIILQWGVSLDEEFALLASFKRVFLTVMVVLLAGAMAVGAFMARRAMSGVEKIARTARRITQNDLDARVPVGRRGDEIDELAVTINQMLDRIQSLVANIRRMNDNIAHDLRSPITRIRGLAEVTLARAHAGQRKQGNVSTPAGQSYLDEFVHMAASTIEECDRLLDMISTMLTISRTESGVEHLDRKPVDLWVTAKQACELFQPVAEDRGIELIMQPENVAGIVNGNEKMLQRMIANLLDNALKYADCGGKVIVGLSVDSVPGMVCLTVTDTGSGIEDRDLPHIFERFYRADQTRGTSGAGLGLSLALAVARVHGGRIEVKSKPGRGSTFKVILPTI